MTLPDASECMDETIPDVSEDEDEDEHCTGVTVAIDTSHWQHASLNTEGMGTIWAQRNLDHPVLPAQTRRGNASKETRKLQAMQVEERWRDLVCATNDAKREIEAILQRVADQHSKKIDVIKQMAFEQTRHCYQHDVSLHDAKISWKMKLEKDKLLPGQTPKTLAEIQTLVKEDTEMANWSKETQEQMMQRVCEIHAIKAQGARVSNHAASMDYRKTVDCIEQELSNLAPRTGAMSIALFTQAHVDDTYVPDIFASSGAEHFVWDVLRMDPLDLVRKFEQWACSQALTLEERDMASNLRKDITSRILAGLRFITKKPSASMSYSRYQTDIIEKYSVEIIGWPVRLRLQGIYNSLFKQTIECAIFVEGYAKKGEIEHLFKMDVSGQAEKFHQAFVDLKNRLSMGFAKEAVFVTLGVQKSVDVLKLGPKSRCMQGTRVETIKEMVSWIAQCDGGTMWCRGLAGTGKSSLMGTLHDLLTTDIGGRSRLAAFVRYDRIEYSKASKLITSIAYALGMFDDRIGRAISLVVQTLPLVVTLSLSLQFQHLLCHPLESLPDLVDGGPLVVVIDGLDECDASDDMLAVLAEGFGPKLSFMRLILSSRPVLRMAKAFEGRDHIYPLHLDTSLESVNRDIQFYLERELAIICDNAFQEKCKELDAVNELTARVSGLFIWAATVARFVHAFPGISRLQALLDTKLPSDATEALTILYRTALDTLVSEPGANVDIKKYVRSVLGAVLVTKTPPGMTEDVLDNIVLGKGSPPAHHIVSMLGSSRCGDEWFVDVTLHRKAIAEQCQTISKSFLKTWSPTESNMDIGAVPAYISKYALFGVFWYSDFDASDLEPFTSFFRHYFLPSLDVVAIDGNTLQFEVMDTFCRQQGLKHLSIETNIRHSVGFHNVLQQSAHFYGYLHQSSKESSLAGKVTLECMKLGRAKNNWEPTGSNLNIDGVIFVDADGETEYGFKFANTTSVPLYVSVFCFHVSDLSILSYYQPGSVKEPADDPLLPGESLTIGYSMSPRTESHMYSVPRGQELDVGFLKLFFSTEYLDLSAIEDLHKSSPSLKGGRDAAVNLDDCEPVIGSAYDDGTNSDFDDDDSD
ncbi:uncharacterized protein ARMOST_21133 [Armillaria ostoyae]|uniref:Nephrocystin 3-like N-terminal domain-containing protein n=1 Tax=Armillaria ostoyae TaxID=47428 RepID=A0A284S9A5_ARMOS|nr:uncharacterized protein ARMOST_21133 [Armillaria ostoyae]